MKSKEKGSTDELLLGAVGSIDYGTARAYTNTYSDERMKQLKELLARASYVYSFNTNNLSVVGEKLGVVCGVISQMGLGEVYGIGVSSVSMVQEKDGLNYDVKIIPLNEDFALSRIYNDGRSIKNALK